MRHLLLIILVTINISVIGQPLAFPGAEGFGKNTVGGRGGKVYYVTSLDDNISTPGTLRWALNQTSPKTILFKISGTIMLKSNLSINKGQTTIAGQSAPGDGICIGGYPVTISANDVIIRFVRFRMGDGLNTGEDGADALGARYYKNIIVDHCSMSWSTDECVSIYGNENTTLQWCIVSESLRLSGHTKGAHGYGGIWGGKNASFHHNLMAHHDSRTPRLGPSTQTQKNEYTDIRNNVYYNYSGEGCYGAEAMNANVINNFYKPGPASNTGTKRGRIIAIDKKIDLPSSDGFYPINNVWGKFYIEGNVVDGSTSSGTNLTVCTNATNNNWEYGVYNQFSSKYGTISAAEKVALKLAAPIANGGVTTHTAFQAYDKVLAFAGASLVRDSHDLRVINETKTGTAAFKGLSSQNASPYPKWGIIDSQNDLKPAGADAGWSPWPTLKSSEAPVDTDGDGMPDAWETSKSLNAGDATDGNSKSIDGTYTNLEVYLNSLVEPIISAQVEGGIYSEKKTLLNKAVHSVKLYPNPASDYVTIETGQPMCQIKVVSVDGHDFQTIECSQQNYGLDVSMLSKGVYLIQVVLSCGSTLTERLFIY